MKLNYAPSTKGKAFYSDTNYQLLGRIIETITDNKTHTISAIAYEAGFNSISSFNSAFKKQTNKTPQAYRQYLTE